MALVDKKVALEYAAEAREEVIEEKFSDLSPLRQKQTNFDQAHETAMQQLEAEWDRDGDKPYQIGPFLSPATAQNQANYYMASRYGYLFSKAVTEQWRNNA